MGRPKLVLQLLALNLRMRNKRRFIIRSLIAFTVLVGIGIVIKNRIQQRAQEVSAAATSTPSLELRASDVMKVQAQDFFQVILISGSLKAKESTIIRAKVAAEIKQILVREGDWVAQGQVIAGLDSTEFDLRVLQAQRLADASKAQLEIAERTYQNQQALAQQGFIAQTALLNAKSNDTAARANLEAALAGLDLARKAKNDSVIRSPIQGQVAQRWMQPGERVAIDGRLLEIVNLQQLELEAALSPDKAALIQIGQTAELRIDGSPQTLKAKVARINPSAQSGSRAVLVYLTLENTPNKNAGQPFLIQGQFARAQIQLGSTSSLTIPPSAIQKEGAVSHVRAWHNGIIQTRRIETGQQGWLLPSATKPPDTGSATHPAVEVIQVLSGLETGDWVLLEGNAQFKEGAKAHLASAAVASKPH